MAQTRNIVHVSANEPFPELIVKAEDGDILQDLSQSRNGQEEMSSSQRSLLSAFDGCPDPDTVLRETFHCKRRTRSTAKLMPLPLAQPPLELYKIESATGYTPTRSQEVIYELAAPFEVIVPEQQKSKRTLNYLVRESANPLGSRQVLFTKMGIVPFEFNIPLEYYNAPGACLAISARYEDSVLKEKLVEMCPVHQKEEDSKLATPGQRLFMQIPDEGYHPAMLAAEGNHFNAIAISPTNSLNLKFACFSSCSSINRRPLILIFDLNGEGLPPQTFQMGLRVCANPKRDAEKDASEKTPNGVKCDPAASTSAATPGHQTSQFRKRSLPCKPVDVKPKIRRSEGAVDDTQVRNVQIIGKEKYEKAVAYIADLERAERYEQAKAHSNLGEPNLFASLSQMSDDTSLEFFLSQVGAGEHAAQLADMGCTTLGSLCEHFTEDLFASIGIEKSMSDYLNRAYLNWRNLKDAADLRLNRS
ncbi:unnamed protein product, partial [Mesorhabditis spiculigera]